MSQTAFHIKYLNITVNNDHREAHPPPPIPKKHEILEGARPDKLVKMTKYPSKKVGGRVFRKYTKSPRNVNCMTKLKEKIFWIFEIDGV